MKRFGFAPVWFSPCGWFLHFFQLALCNPFPVGFFSLSNLTYSVMLQTLACDSLRNIYVFGQNIFPSKSICNAMETFYSWGFVCHCWLLKTSAQGQQWHNNPLQEAFSGILHGKLQEVRRGEEDRDRTFSVLFKRFFFSLQSQK